MQERYTPRKSFAPIACATLASVLATATSTKADPPQWFPGSAHSPAFGVCSDGSLVVGEHHVTFCLKEMLRAYRWDQNDTVVTLPPAAHPNVSQCWLASSANAIADTLTGSVAVGTSWRIDPGSQFERRATLWRENSLPTLLVGGWGASDPSWSEAYGISSDGLIVVGTSGHMLAQWGQFATKGFIVDLSSNPPDITYTPAETEYIVVSPDGESIAYERLVGAHPFSVRTLFLWDEDQEILVDNDHQPRPHAVSNGSDPVIVGSRFHLGQYNGLYAVRWEKVNDDWTAIAFNFDDVCECIQPGACDPIYFNFNPTSEATGVSADGNKISGWVRGSDWWTEPIATKAFVWDRTTDEITIYAPSTDDFHPNALSADGETIVGAGRGGVRGRGWRMDWPTSGCTPPLPLGADDLERLLKNWGPCDDSRDCPSDLNGDGRVDVDDLLILLDSWHEHP